MKLSALNPTHLVACLLVGVTAVLLSFGALVTTYEAAMAVPDWPATYGHNMFLFPMAEWLHGPWDLFLEHGHRLLGATAGLVTLVLAAVCWRQPVTPAVRSLAVADDQRVLVTADARASHQSVVGALSAAADAGLVRVGIATRKGDGG
jgi:heme A synthase